MTQPLEVQCPFCTAIPGEWCHSPSGVLRVDAARNHIPHPSRITAANDRAERWSPPIHLRLEPLDLEPLVAKALENALNDLPVGRCVARINELEGLVREVVACHGFVPEALMERMAEALEQ